MNSEDELFIKLKKISFEEIEQKIKENPLITKKQLRVFGWTKNEYNKESDRRLQQKIEDILRERGMF
jgi:uncharacterized protein YneF (UPF0154 family)